MKNPKFKRGDGVIVPPFGMGVIIEEPEYEDEWTYSVALNNDGWGWFGESEIKDCDDVIKDIEGQE